MERDKKGLEDQGGNLGENSVGVDETVRNGIVNIVQGYDLFDLEAGLVRMKGRGNRQLQKLRLNGFVQNQQSRIEDFQHYIGNGKMALFLGEIGILMDWGDKYVIDNITPLLISAEGGVKCIGFAIDDDSKYYLYKLGEDFPSSGKVEIIPNFQGDEGEFYDEGTRDREMDELSIKEGIDGKEFQEQKNFLIDMGFNPNQLCNIQALTHYVKKKSTGETEYILVDEEHENIVRFQGKVIYDDIVVFTGKNGQQTLQGISTRNQGRFYFHIFGDQYRNTKVPITKYNNTSDDGSFSSLDELKQGVARNTLSGTTS